MGGGGQRICAEAPQEAAQVTNASARTKTITGFVYDEAGVGIPGSTITIKGSTRGVATDLDGSFKIDVSPTDVLEVSFLGYDPYTVTVGDKASFVIPLKPKANELDEVTVVAFGRQNKQDVISAITTVNTKDLQVSSSNLTAAFAGRIPGLISYQSTGEPGADNAQFFVRGITTFGVKKEPLILIDGFEASATDLARLQPDDIESFSILKDAAATVTYGARGANGIIMVVTKGGNEGAVKVNVRVDYNVVTPTRMNKLVDGVTYMKMYNEAGLSRQPTIPPYYSEQKIQSTINGENPMIFPNIDWYDELFKTTTNNVKANLNVSGGGKLATYYVAGGFDHETGLLKVDSRNNFNNNIDISRVHIRSNVMFKLTPTTTLDTRITGRFERYTGPLTAAKDIFGMVMGSNPVDFPAVYESDEAHQYLQHTLFGNTLTGTGRKTNPYAEMVRGYEDRNETTVTAMATLRQDLDFVTKGLKFEAKISNSTWGKYASRRSFEPFYYDLESYNQITGEYKLFDMNAYSGRAYLGDVDPSRDATGNTYMEARLNWERTFDVHTVGLMTVGTMQENLLTGGNSRSIYETLPEKNMGNSGRLNYDYDKRYFFEFVYGYNGSEKFNGAKRFGFFPAAVVGWFVSHEAFWEPVKPIITSLKLKGSWGQVGNDAISGRAGRFFYLSDITTFSDPTVINNGYRWGETFMTSYGGYNVNRYANPDITWETSEKWNGGIELGVLNDDLKFQVDVFTDTRSGIYWVRENFPASAGMEGNISGNVGKVKSHGVDASADYSHFFTNDFWMTGRANFTFAANEVVEKDEKNYSDKYLSRKGYSVDQQWGLLAERLFVDEEEIKNSPKQDFGVYQAGDIKYKDINGDGVINSNDEIPMGYPTTPEIQYGFGLSVGYKNVDLSFFFQGNAHVSFFINPGVDGDGIAPLVNRRNALAVVANDYWSETNPNIYAFWPRLSTVPLNNNIQQSSWWLRDGSFLRLKTLEVGYTLPSFNKIGLKSSRVYLSTENLFVLSAFKLWDPEMGGAGLGYPPNKRFNIGIQLNF
ncbi:SusC/RagA family TonB-linked outer membrane protein [Bacteroidia bacterium]|nr:SusC/RagA family TonB-linked outer membrane protein [Bacteroidia bacterium]